jgi:hypothetical protein
MQPVVVQNTVTGASTRNSGTLSACYCRVTIDNGACNASVSTKTSLCSRLLKGSMLLSQIEGLISDMRESYSNNIGAVFA